MNQQEGMPSPVEYLKSLIYHERDLLNTRLDSEKEARILYAEQLADWKKEVNNVREQINNERGEFATKALVSALTDKIEALLESKVASSDARIASLEATRLTAIGATQTNTTNRNQNQWLIGTILAATAVILTAIVLVL